MRETIKVQPLPDTKPPSCNINHYRGSVLLREARRSYTTSWECNLAPWTQKDENNFNLKMVQHENEETRVVCRGSRASRQLTETHKLKLKKLNSFADKKKSVCSKKYIGGGSGSLPIGSHSMSMNFLYTQSTATMSSSPIAVHRSSKGLLKFKQHLHYKNILLYISKAWLTALKSAKIFLFCALLWWLVNLWGQPQSF